MTTHRTVGSAGEIDKAREHLDELRAQIDNLPGEIDQAYANGDPAMARRLDDRLQVARRQVNDAAETLARLERPAVTRPRTRNACTRGGGHLSVTHRPGGLHERQHPLRQAIVAVLCASH